MTALAIDDGLILVLTWTFVVQTILVIGSQVFIIYWLWKHWPQRRHQPPMIPRTDIVEAGWLTKWKSK